MLCLIGGRQYSQLGVAGKAWRESDSVANPRQLQAQ